MFHSVKTTWNHICFNLKNVSVHPRKVANLVQAHSVAGRHFHVLCMRTFHKAFHLTRSEGRSVMPGSPWWDVDGAGLLGEEMPAFWSQSWYMSFIKKAPVYNYMFLYVSIISIKCPRVQWLWYVTSSKWSWTSPLGAWVEVTNGHRQGEKALKVGI